MLKEAEKDVEVSVPQEAKTEQCGHAVRTPHIWDVPGSNFDSQTGCVRFSQVCQANTGTDTY